MVKLNETIVCGRTKMSSVANVRRLNCWGCDLDDVSIVEEMPNIEVLSLSVNNITTLKHFRECRRLRELYLRGNRISDLREVEHLQSLTDLRVLWLDENPCAQSAGYRNFIIRTLPFLTNLDNRPVSQSEAYENVVQIAPSVSKSKSKDSEELVQRSKSRQNGVVYESPLQPKNHASSNSSYDFGYDSASPEHPNKSFQGRNFYHQENAFINYVSPASNTNGTVSPAVPSSQCSAPSTLVLRQTSGNVLKAILALLDDLDEQSLSIVAQEVSHRMQNYS